AAMRGAGIATLANASAAARPATTTTEWRVNFMARLSGWVRDVPTLGGAAPAVLNRSCTLPEPPGTAPHPGRERAGHVALVREPRVRGDPRERLVIVREHPQCALDAQPARERADCDAIVVVERPRQMGAMDAQRGRQLGEHRAAVFVMHAIACFLEPA